MADSGESLSADKLVFWDSQEKATMIASELTGSSINHFSSTTA